MSTPQSQPLYQAFYTVTRWIPLGKVATYGQVARWAGYPGYARQVGYALFRLADSRDPDVPWQRVVNAQGRISTSPLRYGSDDLQRVLLESEGIPFNAQGQIDLSVYGWTGPEGGSPTEISRDPHTREKSALE